MHPHSRCVTIISWTAPTCALVYNHILIYSLPGSFACSLHLSLTSAARSLTVSTGQSVTHVLTHSPARSPLHSRWTHLSTRFLTPSLALILSGVAWPRQPPPPPPHTHTHTHTSPFPLNPLTFLYNPRIASVALWLRLLCPVREATVQILTEPSSDLGKWCPCVSTVLALCSVLGPDPLVVPVTG